jgi:hypothetical protein
MFGMNLHPASPMVGRVKVHLAAGLVLGSLEGLPQMEMLVCRIAPVSILISDELISDDLFRASASIRSDALF